MNKPPDIERGSPLSGGDDYLMIFWISFMIQLRPFKIMADSFIIMADSSIIMASPFIIMNTMDMTGFFVGYHIYCLSQEMIPPVVNSASALTA